MLGIGGFGGGGGGGGVGGLEALASGADSGSVTFITPFVAAPAVVLTFQDTSDAQSLVPRLISVTASGFDFGLSAPTTSTNCSLHWSATEI